VVRSPDVHAGLMQRIETLCQQRKTIKLLYTFHYSLRNRTPFSHNQDSRQFEDTLPNRSDATTVTEHRLLQLNREIRECEERLEHAKRAENNKVEQMGKLVGVLMPPGWRCTFRMARSPLS
jgi:hypothetical protein